MQLRTIIEALGSQVTAVYGGQNRTVRAFEAFDEKASASALAFFRFGGPIPPHFQGMVFCLPQSVPNPLNPRATYITCLNPRLAMIRALRLFSPEKGTGAIHESANISNDARVGRDVAIGPFCVIGAAEIGDGGTLYSGVQLYDNVHIGSHVVIDSGTVIGASGFGYERNDRGALERFPHIGAVMIGDDVEIGANVTIDRGSLRSTIVERGTKIDNGAYIAHNVVVGEDTMIMANATICGTAHIGQRCWIAPGAVIRDGVRIGDDATVGLGAVVVNDVASGVTVMGNPARPKRA